MSTFSIRAGCACTALAFGLAACGGSGGGDATIHLASVADLDGFVNSAGGVYRDGFGPAAGDLDAVLNGVGNRMFYSFALSPVPPAATLIVSATLYVSEEGTFGDPYPFHGSLVVDHLDYGTSLDAGDYGAPALETAFAEFSADAFPGYHPVDVTAQVRADWSLGRPRSQFRLRFAWADSDFDGMSEGVLLNDSEDSYASGRTPFLAITFR